MKIKPLPDIFSLVCFIKSYEFDKLHHFSQITFIKYNVIGWIYEKGRQKFLKILTISNTEHKLIRSNNIPEMMCQLCSESIVI